MTAMEGNLSTPFGIVVLIIFGMVSIASLLGNGFIIVVNSHRWFQTQKLVPCDLLLTCLSIFRFLMQCATLLGHYTYISSPMDYICTYISRGVDVVWMFFTMANFSGTSCLIIFYCMKVTTFAHPIFLWLKSRIDSFVPHMLAMSLIVSGFFYLLPGLNFWSAKASCNLSRNLTANTSHTEASEAFSDVITNYPQFLFSAINFGICLTASILLIISLWRHTRNLKRSGICAKDISTQAHIKVIKQLTFFLLFYILYFVAIIIAMGEIFKYGKVERLVCDILLSLYPSAHSIILIRTNPKLKGACARILPTPERSS